MKGGHGDYWWVYFYTVGVARNEKKSDYIGPQGVTESWLLAIPGHYAGLYIFGLRQIHVVVQSIPYFHPLARVS
jgi:hypothetical protein